MTLFKVYLLLANCLLCFMIIKKDFQTRDFFLNIFEFRQNHALSFWLNRELTLVKITTKK